MEIDIEVLIFSISLVIAVICLILGLIRGLNAANTLGGGVLSMVMTWLIFISILYFNYPNEEMDVTLFFVSSTTKRVGYPEIEVLWLNLFLGIIITYFASCLIVWIYDKVKKK